MTDLSPIHVFQAGARTDSAGRTFHFTEDDLARSAAAYDPAVHEAPLVIGHPASDAPAYGWVRSFRAVGADLMAEPHQVAPEFMDWVRAGHYKKISISFYLPNAAANPSPGVYYPRHVGFLGAQPPAVKGLRSPTFGAGDDGVVIVEFAETDSSIESSPTMSDPDPAAQFAERENQLAAREQQLIQREQELAARERAARSSAATTFADSLVQAGRLLPRQRAGLIELLVLLDSGATLNFAEDGQAPAEHNAADWLRGFLQALPVSVDYREAGANTSDKDQPSDVEISRRAQVYRQSLLDAGMSVSFTEAVDAVRNGKDK